MRMHIKNNNKIKKYKQKTLIIFFLIVIYILFKLTININEIFLNYSREKAKIIINDTVSKSLTEETIDKMKQNEIYKITKNSKNEIETINYNTYEVNSLLKEVSKNVENTLKKEENKNNNIYFKIPLGAITKSPILSSKGPKIPVKMEVIGSTLSKIKTNIKEYGINNALIEMSINIEVEEKIMLPVSSNIIKVSTEIPISYSIIKGNIPTYYGGEISKESHLYQGLLNKG